MAEISDMGPTGRTVAWNVRRLRQERNLTYAALSKMAAEAGRRIPPLALRRIEARARRVDVDDLMALAIALDVNPNALLLNPTIVSNHKLSLSGAGRPVSAGDAWAWARGERPLDYSRAHAGRDLTNRDINDFRARLVESFEDRTAPGYPSDPGPGVTRVVDDVTESDLSGHRVIRDEGVPSVEEGAQPDE